MSRMDESREPRAYILTNGEGKYQCELLKVCRMIASGEREREREVQETDAFSSESFSII